MDERMNVRALARGLQVLEELSRRGSSTLHQLHLATGLPKSSLRRLLATLVERRYVRVGLSDGRYRSNVATPHAPDRQDDLRIGRLVEVARPHMIELTRAATWPADLHVRVGNRMRIIESTHGQSPFAVIHDLSMEAELNMFAAASGYAYLAALSDEAALALADACMADDFASPERYGVRREDLPAALHEVRTKGYGVRKRSQLKQDERNALAVAIPGPDGPAGAVAMAWPKQLMTPEAFAERHLPAIRAAAAAISQGLMAIAPSATAPADGPAHGLDADPRATGAPCAP